MARTESKPETIEYRLTVDAEGKVALPPDLIARLGIVAGDKLILRVEPDNSMTLLLLREQVRKLRGLYAHIAPGRSLVDELIAERREEARREEEEARRWEGRD